AGILMLQFSGERRLLDRLHAQGVPVVVVSCWAPHGDCVAVDDEFGTAAAVAHLIELGHRRIAYVTSELVERSTDRERYRGYCRGLEGATLPVEDELVVRWR